MCCFFVAGGDATKMIDGIEELFDEVAFAVEREVVVALDFSVCFGRDHRLNGPHLNALDEGVVAISFVSKHCFGFDLSREYFCLCEVVRLAPGPGEADRERGSKSIHNGVDLNGQTAA